MKYTVGIVVGVLLIFGGWYLLFSNERGADSPADLDENAVTEPSLTIAASFYPLEFAAKRIAGDLAEVVNIGGGRDPHDVQLSTQDVLAMQQADLVVLQGAELEPWGDDMIEQLEADGVPVHIATAYLTLMALDEHEDEHGDEHDEHAEESEEEHEGEEEEHEDEHDHGEFDPHTWLDPILFSETVAHLTEAIVALDSDNAATYEANAAALQAELIALDAEYESRLMNCELEEVITSHDAFGYIGSRYDFEIHAIAGLSTQDLPSATTLAELREEAEEGIGAILLEENSVASYGEALARETGLATLSINPIAYSVPTGEDYVTLMRTNLYTFAVALNCNG